MTPKELTQITEVMRQVMADREEDLYRRMENAARGLVMTELENGLYHQLHQVIRDAIKREVSVDVRLKNAPKE